MKRVSLNLKRPVCTEDPDPIVHTYDQTETNLVENTGIEREGGITNIYETEATFPTAGANSIITTDGKVLQVDAANNVRLDNVVIGNVGPCAVYRRGMLPGGYLDAAWTVTGTIIGIKKAGTTITVDEYDPATGTVTNTRDSVFAGMPTANILYVSLVKYVDMTYAADQEFLIGLNSSAVGSAWLLREAGLSSTDLVLYVANQMWRFAAGKYLIWRQGVTSSCYIGDVGAWTNLIDVKWVIIDRFVGTTDSRAILTFNPYDNAAHTFAGMAVVGYNGAGAYDAVRSYKGIALGAVTVVVSNPITAPGYSECSYVRSDTTPVTQYYLAPQPRHAPAAYYQGAICPTGITPGINGYGKLNDIEDNNTFLTSLRVCMINGVPSYLSVAPNGVDYDCIGVPITNVGEFDEGFMPHVVDDNATFTKVIYRYAEKLFFVDIRSGQAKSIYKLNPNVYQVNTISAFSIIDTATGLMQLGVNDYNGRVIDPGNDVATIKVALVLKSPYANSIDTGEKVRNPHYIDGMGSWQIPGSERPTFLDRHIEYSIDVFQDGLYQVSYYGHDYTLALIDIARAGTLYIPDWRLPIAMGYNYGDGTAQTEFSTIFTGIAIIGSPDIEYGYAGYEIGNDISGLYQSFTLFGQRYLFDGFQIWLASFTNVSYAGKQFLCPATGMTLVATSPTAVYFLSAFDNSIYTFDGGRSLTKFHRFNKLSAITHGVYNVRDNTLLLDAGANFIWVRDSIITINAKKANQAGTLGLYDTTGGIVIANNTLSWKYSWTATGTLVLLKFQTGYFGVGLSGRGIADRYIITLYSSMKVTTTITVHYDAFDQDTSYTQTEYLPIKASDYTPDGMVRIKFTPRQSRAMAASIGIQCADKIVLLDITVEYTEEADATIPTSRSR